jgi:hypothetical protein
VHVSTAGVKEVRGGLFDIGTFSGQSAALPSPIPSSMELGVFHRGKGFIKGVPLNLSALYEAGSGEGATKYKPSPIFHLSTFLPPSILQSFPV